MTQLTEAQALSEIVRVSRKLGADPSLVLHGGGNTSIKVTRTDVTGPLVQLVLVKGSGSDLATIGPAGFTALRLVRLLELLRLDTLNDAIMINELRMAALDADAPTPSIEALMHARIPARVVLHSHADAVVALTNRDVDIQDVVGPRVHVLPFAMPGFPLAALINSVPLDDIDAIILRNHGLVTFADDGDEAFRRHREIVRKAEDALGVHTWGEPGERIRRGGTSMDMADLRRAVSDAAGRPLLLQQSQSARARAFAQRPDTTEVTSRGTITADHVIYTKRLPLVGRDVTAYANAYREYVTRNRYLVPTELAPVDPAPRVVLDPVLGLAVAGPSPGSLTVARDIALHTMDVIDAADAAGGYRSFDEAVSFQMEYSPLEQAKLLRRSELELAGEVAVVTGAASGIGRAVAQSLLDRGAAVVGIDLDPGVETAFTAPGWRGIVGDAADNDILALATDAAARNFGGIDILVAAAGIFPKSAPVSELDDALWDKAFRVNVTAVARVFRAAHPFLLRSPRGGRVVLISTKNVVAPGPGAAAYSASKAAAAQLARVAALEWAGDGIRVNQVEPDAVFDTGIWTEELLAERAARYGLSVDEYRARNLLGVEVTSTNVADAVLLFCVALPATTGAHLSVDGGNNRVI